MEVGWGEKARASNWTWESWWKGSVRLSQSLLLSTICGRQWLADALKENDPSNVLLFLVGSKKDLSVSVPVGDLPTWVRGPTPSLTLIFPQTPAQYSLMEKYALKVAQEIKAEYWAVSSLTGELGAPAFCHVSLPTSPLKAGSSVLVFP